MPLNPEIRDQAYQFFIEEASELLQVIEQGLLNLHQDRSTSKVHELMRAAHSIKGGAASVELNAIELLAHRLEDFFKALYSDDVEFDKELENLLLQGYDCLSHPLNQQIESGSIDEEAALLAAEPVFTAIEARLGSALENSDSYIPSSNDLGVDIIASIFEIDVAGAIEYLQTVLASPDRYNSVAELQRQLDLFAGFAELFNLSGFSDIVETAKLALDSYPQRVLSIIKAVIADCTIARERVLAGDRTVGGEVSTTLQKLAFAETLDPDSNLEFDPIELEESSSRSNLAESLIEDIFNPIIADSIEPAPSQTDSTTESDLEEFNSPIANSIEAESLVENIFDNIPDIDLRIDEITQLLDIFSSESLQNNSADEPTAPEPVEIETAPTNTTAIDSIENIFDLASKEILAAKTSQSQPQTTEPEQAARKLFVKVDLERLDKMNNLLGELTINRNSLTLQNQQLQENVSQLGRKFLRFDKIIEKIRTLSDLMLVEQRLDSLTSSNHRDRHSNYGIEELNQFDSLEMDSYNSLNSSLSEILEEITLLEESLNDINIFARQSDRTISEQRKMLDRMRSELMWVRMLPLEEVLQRFPRILRDLSHKYHKPVELKLSGTDILVDRAVLEKMSDPLLHLLRNAFDHGIEEPEERTEQGKPATGSISIEAYYQGNQTVIEVRDDGRGLDTEKIARLGVERGLISEEEAQTATSQELFDLIFEPGFSTASEVNEISGRGIGMDIVRSQITALKGRISVASTNGKGSLFTLRLPLTLSIAKLLVCSLGTTALAIPSDSIEEIIVPTTEQIKLAHQQKLLSFNRQLIPIYPLKKLLQYNCAVPASAHYYFKTVEPPKDWLAPLLLLRRGHQLFALEVVSLLDEQELVIKPYGKAIAAPAYTYGCTILGDGSLIPVFDGSAIISMILGETTPSESQKEESPQRRETNAENAIEGDESKLSSYREAKRATVVEPHQNPPQPTLQETRGTADIPPLPQKTTYRSPISRRTTPKIETIEQIPSLSELSSLDGGKVEEATYQTIMVVDDSTTLRRTLALTLEKQGYRVIQRKDGKDALDGFKQNPDLDLIICDIEMPVMNGLEFLGMRRRDSILSQIPTLMLTSRGGRKHRNLATQLGADDYFIKPYDESELIAKVKDILSSDRTVENNSTPAVVTDLPTILVIDDSAALRRTLTLGLEKKGYRVLQARDGAEGLETLRNNLQTKLVICDLEMPNTNGFEFLTMRRQERELAKIPTIVLTSRGSDKHRALADSLGASEFFIKPYVEEQFLRDVAKFIND